MGLSDLRLSLFSVPRMMFFKLAPFSTPVNDDGCQVRPDPGSMDGHPATRCRPRRPSELLAHLRESFVRTHDQLPFTIHLCIETLLERGIRVLYYNGELDRMCHRLGVALLDCSGNSYFSVCTEA